MASFSSSSSSSSQFSFNQSWFNFLPLTLALILLLSLLLLPLPFWLMDSLLTINLAFCLCLLLSTLLITHRLSLSVFPSLLLIATLFRLGLHVATTRLILTQGHGGHLIQALGAVTTGGSWIVGLILFALLTLVQFLVVAKGAERVAEVGARFTLDALPGKQMSIDADLRSGMISQEEAKNQREILQQSAHLFGAMDGAMKFVKGDAIAGIVMTLINFFGGICLGIFSREMNFAQALQSYAILSIGDGLVSQITAQLVALSAAFMVTAVDDAEKKYSLSHYLWSQLIAQPKILNICGLLLFCLGLLPGVPILPFWILSMILFSTYGILIWRTKQNLKIIEVENRFQNTNYLNQPMPLSLKVSLQTYQRMQGEEIWQRTFYEFFPKLRFYLSQKMGMNFPLLEFCADLSIQDTSQYKICLWEHSIIEGQFQTQAPVEKILRQLAKLLKRHAREFLGIQEVQDRLHLLAKQYPDLVREVVPKWITLHRLTEILQRLVEEGIPIKDLRAILQILAGKYSDEQDTLTLTEQVRLGLKRHLSSLYTNAEGQLFAFTLDSKIEEEIRLGIRRQGEACYLLLEPERIKEISELIRLEIESFSEKAILKSKSPPVILTQGELRRYVRKLIEWSLPETPVLAYEELCPEIGLKSLGTLGAERINLPRRDRISHKGIF